MGMVKRRRASFFLMQSRKGKHGRRKMLPPAQGDYSIFRLPRKGLILAGRRIHTRPDYVARYEDKTHFASLVAGHWYLYEKVPGEDPHRYIGAITKNGICPKKPRKPHKPCSEQAQPESTESTAAIALVPLGVEVYEYGFSKAVLDLCPKSWKDKVGRKWKAVLIEIIVGQSPCSYLQQERNAKGVRVSIGNHRRSLQKKIGISLDELSKMLGNIFWIRSGINGISSLSDAQKKFCQDHHICLEVMS